MERTAMMLVLTALLALMCAYGGQCCPVCPTIDIHTELKELRTWLEDLTHRLSTTQRDLEQERAAKRVAFSASLLGPNTHQGPFDEETNLIFGNVITNVGNAYNASTGIFTAPVKGLYFFRYSGRALSSRDMGLSIFKRGHRIVSSYDTKSGEHSDSISNGVTLELDIGDEVYMRLWRTTWILMNKRYSFCTFSGFLVTPM